QHRASSMTWASSPAMNSMPAAAASCTWSFSVEHSSTNCARSAARGASPPLAHDPPPRQWADGGVAGQRMQPDAVEGQSHGVGHQVPGLIVIDRGDLPAGKLRPPVELDLGQSGQTGNERHRGRAREHLAPAADLALLDDELDDTLARAAQAIARQPGMGRAIQEPDRRLTEPPAAGAGAAALAGRRGTKA